MDLILKTKKAVAMERSCTTEIIKYLALIEKTQLFAKMGYSSMIKFCIRELGYSEGSAYRRVEAARLLKTHPSLEDKFKLGELSLINAANANRFIKVYKIENSINLVSELLNKSSREAEFILLSKSNQEIKRKNILRRVSTSDFDLSVTLKEDIVKKLLQIKDRKSHSIENYEELLGMMINSTLEKIHKPVPKKLEQRSRSATPALKNFVLKRANHKCQFPGCEATAFLQVDHVQAYSKGGKTSLFNSQILCFTHNQLKGAAVGNCASGK